MINDTIAAISTPWAKGGIGIVRMSGEKCMQITGQLFADKNGNNITEGTGFKSHTIRYGFIFSDTEKKEIIDEVLLTYMKAPNTYTREDIVEINCHSGIAVLNRIMERLLALGARQADNGEFTKRAFLNGRIDLTQAEAVIDIINAKTEQSGRIAANQLQGRLYREIRALMDSILLCLANIEVSIDYPEHDDEVGQDIFLREKIGALVEKAERLYATSDAGRIIKEGISAVIVGETNVGKSSLLNYFAGCERAIVTDIHGTTRDILEESVNVNGIILKLTDTAGIRQTNDFVEKIGIDRAKKAVRDADLVLAIIDGSKETYDYDFVDESVLPESAKVIAVINKTDLDIRIDTEEIYERFGRDMVVMVSVKNGTGLCELESKIKQLFLSGGIGQNDGAVISNMRQKDALARSIESLKNALISLDSGFPADIISVDLTDSCRSLGEITGDNIDETLIETIFSEFCLGK